MKTVRQEFSKATKIEAYIRADGHCEECRQKIITRAEYDHILPCGLGGDASIDNCKVLCVKCHKTKTVERDRPANDKAVRLIEKRAGARQPKGRGFDKRYSRKMDGTVVRRET